MLKNIYIRFLLFWEDAMFSLTESWKEVNIEELDECSSNVNDVQHVATVSTETIKGEN